MACRNPSERIPLASREILTDAAGSDSRHIRWNASCSQSSGIVGASARERVLPMGRASLLPNQMPEQLYHPSRVMSPGASARSGGTRRLLPTYSLFPEDPDDRA